MGKVEDMRRKVGANVEESASKRDAAATSPMNGSYPGSAAPRPSAVPRSKNAFEIPLDRIDPDPDQPREEFEPEALARLAESLRTRGQLQPCRVRPSKSADGRYTLICGERRWRAARMAELETLSCVVSEGEIDDGELLALQLIENALREDLRPIDQAKAYRTLMERSQWSGNRLAQELGIAQSSVVHALKLLELPVSVQEMVEQGTLSPSTAYEFTKVDGPEEQQALAEKVVAEDMSRAQAVEEVRRSAGRAKSRGASKGKTWIADKLRKHRGPRGIRLVAQTAARHSLADLVADLEDYVRRLRDEMGEGAQDAA